LGAAAAGAAVAALGVVLVVVGAAAVVIAAALGVAVNWGLAVRAGRADGGSAASNALDG